MDWRMMDGPFDPEFERHMLKVCDLEDSRCIQSTDHCELKYEWIRFLPGVGGRMLDVSDLEDSRCIQSTDHCGVNGFFHDSVHGSIKLHPLLTSIIYTPQFQLLRDIKPLGLHNRFEHCIGTAYLCGKMLQTLRNLHENEYRDPVPITDTDILCVEIAGLCHDLGRGPFSHAFYEFLKATRTERRVVSNAKLSCLLFDDIINCDPNLESLLQEYNIYHTERKFIKRLIMGRNPENDTIEEQCTYHEKTYTNWFLYEILANRTTGIDCDKFDYFARDSHHLGMTNSFNHESYMQNVRIFPVEDGLHICVRDNEENNLYEIFHVQLTLHRRVCQNKTLLVIQHMIFEALEKVGGFRNLKLICRMGDYSTLIDSRLFYILRKMRITFCYPSVEEARRIIRDVQEGKFYRFCGQVILEGYKIIDKHLIANDNIDEQSIANEISSHSEKVDQSHLLVGVIKFNYGMNPIERVRFFDKRGKLIKRDEYRAKSEMLPRVYRESIVRVYCKNAELFEQVNDCFHKWSEEKGYIRGYIK